jgi:Domain of unknown function (DUF1877)
MVGGYKFVWYGLHQSLRGQGVHMSMICELYIVPAETLQRLLAEPDNVDGFLESLEQSDSMLSLGKSWHGLHFVFTGKVWEGDPPLNFLVAGGVPIGDEDLGYGPVRAFDPAGVTALNQALTAFSDADFNRNFDLTALLQAEIYPSIWDEPIERLQQEYGEYFREMKAHVQRASESRQAILVSLT